MIPIDIPNVNIQNETPQLVIFVCSTANQAVVDLLSDEFNFELCLRKLDLVEQRVVRNNRHSPIKALVLRLFAKYVLNSCLCIERVYQTFDAWAEIKYSYNKFGKPAVNSGSGTSFQFNSSSSNDLAAIIVQFGAELPVGIDLSHESQNSISPDTFMEQFDGIFLAREKEYLDGIANLKSRYVAFNHLWTLKEAFTKFLGTGLNIDLRSFSFNIEESLLVEGAKAVLQGSLKESLAWNHGVKVDTQRLPEDLKQLVDARTVTCASAILKETTDDSDPKTLPVILSIVHQTLSIKYTHVPVDMKAILEDIIKNL